MRRCNPWLPEHLAQLVPFLGVSLSSGDAEVIGARTGHSSDSVKATLRVMRARRHTEAGTLDTHTTSINARAHSSLTGSVYRPDRYLRGRKSETAPSALETAAARVSPFHRERECGGCHSVMIIPRSEPRLLCEGCRL